MYENSKLLEQLRFYKLDYLIPIHLNSLDDDAEGIAHTYKQFDEELDPADDHYYDKYFGEDDDELNTPDEDIADGEEHIATNIDDLLNIFDADYADPEEFLESNIWDLFGITKKQFDLIQWEHIQPESFCEFFDTFMNEKRDLPIEKRIIYSVAQACTDYKLIQTEGGDECSPEEMLEYAERIIDHHTMDEVRELIPLLLDYLRFYYDAQVMNERRIQNGEEPFRYTRRPKPSHIEDLHDKAFRDCQAMETERLAKNREAINEAIKDISETPDYTRFLYSGDEYVVLPAKSQDDLDYEGEYLNHCVATYGSYMAKGHSFIYFVRKADDPKTPYFTAEIIPSFTTHYKPKLNQLYTFDDKIDKSNSLRDFVIKWSKTKGFAIKCKL